GKTSVGFLVSNTGGSVSVAGSLPWCVAMENADQSGLAVDLTFDPALADKTIALSGATHLANLTPGEAVRAGAVPQGLTIANAGDNADFLPVKVDPGTAVTANGTAVTGSLTAVNGYVLAQSQVPQAFFDKARQLSQDGVPLGLFVNADI